MQPDHALRDFLKASDEGHRLLDVAEAYIQDGALLSAATKLRLAADEFERAGTLKHSVLSAA